MFPSTASAAMSNGTHLPTASSSFPAASAESSQTQHMASSASLLAATTALSTNGSVPMFAATGQYSAATAEVLRRMSENGAAHTGTPGYEAAREQILRGIVTSDRLPVPPPMSTGKRGRGGRGGISRTDSVVTPSASSWTPDMSRGRPRGRPRGRGRGSGRGRGRGGKRKREDSEAEDSDLSLSDEGKLQDGDANELSDSYTPLPTKTKSGRSVTKPAQFVPTIASPSGPKKKRAYRRNPESALCKACHRGHSPANNQVVFCDGCVGAYHQYCHDPPIDKEVILVPEKEWFCTSCVKERNEVIAGTTLEGLISGEKLTLDEVRSSSFILATSSSLLLTTAAETHLPKHTPAVAPRRPPPPRNGPPPKSPTIPQIHILHHQRSAKRQRRTTRHSTIHHSTSRRASSPTITSTALTTAAPADVGAVRRLRHGPARALPQTRHRRRAHAARRGRRPAGLARRQFWHLWRRGRGRRRGRRGGSCGRSGGRRAVMVLVLGAARRALRLSWPVGIEVFGFDGWLWLACIAIAFTGIHSLCLHSGGRSRLLLRRKSLTHGMGC